MQIYDFQVKQADGTMLPLSTYRGKVLLIVNTASKCGFTPQYADLQRLYEKYESQGLQILAFPCNQFKEQEPQEDEKIQQFCSANYGVRFPVLAKTQVKGDSAEPLFVFLTKGMPFQGFDKGHPLTAVLEEMLFQDNPDAAKSNEIQWNFTKFLISRDGGIVQRFEPTTDMSAVEGAVKNLL